MTLSSYISMELAATPLTTAHDLGFSWRHLISFEIVSPYGWYLRGAGIENATEANQGLIPPKSLGVIALDDHTLQVQPADLVAYFSTC